MRESVAFEDQALAQGRSVAFEDQALAKEKQII